MDEGRKNRYMRHCEECGGTGEVEQEIFRTHNCARDVGYVDTRWAICEWCNGDGILDEDEDDED